MITEKDIEKIAILAKLEIATEDIPVYKEEMEKMLCFAENIECCEDIPEQNAQPADYNELRDDVTFASFDCDEIISNAADSLDGFIRLGKKA